jgi:hypothetical protein
MSSDLWEICARFVDRPTEKAKARGTFQASVALDLDLQCEADGVPHEHHVNVLGWPDSGSKDKLKNIQQKLAAAMTGRLEPRP